MIQAIEASSPRREVSASANPICLARSCCSAGSRPARIAINTRLSIPSTISSAVSVKRLAQRPGSVSQSIPTPPFVSLSQITGESPRAFPARLGSSQLPAGFDSGVREFRAQFRLRNGDAVFLEVGLYLLDDIGVARCFEVSGDHGLGRSLRPCRQADPAARPPTTQTTCCGAR